MPVPESAPDCSKAGAIRAPGRWKENRMDCVPIDWERVDVLRAEVGSAFDEVLDLFLEEMDEAIGKIPASSDPEALAEALHFLRGSASNLGLNCYCEMSRKIEAEVAKGHAVSVQPLIDAYAKAKDILLAAAAGSGSRMQAG